MSLIITITVNEELINRKFEATSTETTDDRVRSFIQVKVHNMLLGIAFIKEVQFDGETFTIKEEE